MVISSPLQCAPSMGNQHVDSHIHQKSMHVVVFAKPDQTYSDYQVAVIKKDQNTII